MSRPSLKALTVALLAAGLIAVASAKAQNSPQRKLHEVEQQLEQSRQRQEQLSKQARDLAGEIQALRDDEVRVAADAQAHEATLDRLDEQLRRLAAQEQAETAELGRKRSTEGRVLVALARLARDPPTALALAPSTPIDAVRGGLLLGRAVPPLVARARALGAEIEHLRATRAQITSAETQQRTERAELARDQVRIAALLARRQAFQRQTQEELEHTGHRQAALAARVGTLRELIARLEADHRAAEQRAASRAVAPPLTVTAGEMDRAMDGAAPKIRSIGQAKGRFAMPTTGLLVAHFGDALAGGMTSKGLTFETRPGAQVVAPFDGRVLYAGPFKGYHQILIIGHGGGYYSVLAGLGHIEQSAGQWLVAGEPVGIMPQEPRRPRLYLELRDNGQPINPLPWLAIHDEKVNG